jgi:folate-dependent phosphoribosylglycinamide formyltransferase PurN
VVDAGVDTGPIVAQAAVPVEDDDDVESLHERIKVAERAMLVDASAGWPAKASPSPEEGRTISSPHD